jgi:hypothetical protein
MTADRYIPFLPVIEDWIQQTLDGYAHESLALSSFPFARLGRYVSSLTRL